MVVVVVVVVEEEEEEVQGGSCPQKEKFDLSHWDRGAAGCPSLVQPVREVPLNRRRQNRLAQEGLRPTGALHERTDEGG